MTYTAWMGRKFGVEMEMTERGLTGSRIRSALQTALPAGRVSTRSVGYYHSDGSTWDVKTDATAGTPGADFGFEVASPALLMNEDGHNEEFKAGTNALAHMRPYITSADGVHVHIDVSDYGWDDLRKLMILWARYEPFFFSLIPPGRRNSTFCRPSRRNTWEGPDSQHWTNISQAVESGVQRNFERFARMHHRGAMNVAHFWRSRRVEFRLHSGTVDYEKLRHWVILLLSLAGRVKQTDMPRIERGRYVDKPLTTKFIAKVLGLAPTKYKPEINPKAADIVAYLERRRKRLEAQAGSSVGRSVQPRWPSGRVDAFAEIVAALGPLPDIRTHD